MAGLPDHVSTALALALVFSASAAAQSDAGALQHRLNQQRFDNRFGQPRSGFNTTPARIEQRLRSLAPAERQPLRKRLQRQQIERDSTALRRAYPPPPRTLPLRPLLEDSAR